MEWPPPPLSAINPPLWVGDVSETSRTWFGVNCARDLLNPLNVATF